MLRIVILFSLWSVLVCFQPHMKQLSPSSVKIFRNHVILEAKKKSGESKGFAKKSLIDLASIQTMTSSDDMLSNKTEIVQSDRSVNDEMFLNEGSMPMQVSSGVANGKKKSQTSSAVTQRGNFKTENEVFSKYGIKDGSDKNVKKSNTKTSNNEPENAAFGKSVLAKFPAKVQAQLDSTLITLTFGALIVVIITGISISFGAFKLVYPQVAVAPEIDNLIENILAPAFSPSLVVFFIFSITFGLFKFAQISSEETVYKE